MTFIRREAMIILTTPTRTFTTNPTMITQPLGDVMPEYWEKPSWTHDEPGAIIQQFATSNLSDTPWSHVESLFSGVGISWLWGKGSRK